MHPGGILTEYNSLKIFQFPAFKKSGLVSHGFTTRLGGVGEKPYDSLNLAFHVGDRPETVISNRRMVCEALGGGLADLVSARQVHGVNIAVVDRSHAGRGAQSYESALPDTDGLVTDVPGLLLATFYADCVPVFILDPVHKAIATVHAGWQGTVARIGAAAVRRMAETFGSRPADLLVGIGPSIGACCYEVSEPVISRVKDSMDWWPEVLTPGKPGHAALDLWEANRKILLEAGVVQDNVEISCICTCCHRQTLFSYRGEQGVTGRMGAFLMLKG